MFRAPSILIFLGIFLLTGCTPPLGTPYIKTYHEALRIKGKVLQSNNISIAKFAELYADINHPDTLRRAAKLYAENAYFNDTFNTFSNKKQIVDYIKHIQENIINSSTTIQDVAVSDNNYYVRWEMRLQAEPKGKAIDTTSIGMTHLRFNSDGKIILHQDYWDPVEALYQHLPYVGGIFRSVRNRL